MLIIYFRKIQPMALIDKITALRDLVNHDLERLRKSHRIQVFFENNNVYVHLCTPEQLLKGTSIKAIGGTFTKPNEALQFLEGFHAGILQPSIVMANRRILCPVCSWWGTVEQLNDVTVGTVNQVDLKTCPNCDSHNLITS
jgi:hypothetical protein